MTSETAAQELLPVPRSILSTLAILFGAKLGSAIVLVLLAMLGLPVMLVMPVIDVALCAWAAWATHPKVGPGLLLRFIAFFFFITTIGAMLSLSVWMLYGLSRA